MAARRLLEGFTAGVGNALRGFFSRAPERAAVELRRGADPAAERAGLPYNLVTQFGYDNVAAYLRIDQDLQQKYTDYEEMDEYPELSCFSQETIVALPGKHDSIGGMAITDVSHRTIGQLAKDYEDGKHRTLLVYAFDHEAGRVVVAEANGPVKTGRRQVYRVTYEEYRGEERRTWSIKATYEHLFMLRDGSYRAAIDLEPGDRLMPCTFKVDSNGYLVVYEPLKVTSGGKATYAAVHGLVAEALCGRVLVDDEVVHHRNGDKTDPSPSNLDVVRRGDHVRTHLADVVAETDRRRSIAKTVTEKWSNPEYKRRVSEAHSKGGGSWLSTEKSGGHKRRQVEGKLSDEHRAAIARGRTIPLAKDVVEAAIRTATSWNDAAKSLGVSWNTLMRRVDTYEIDWTILGTNARGPRQGDEEYLNHRVISVERLGEEDVYDLEVPDYHNFAVGDGGDGFVFVHNCGLDIYADDATSPSLDREQAIWAVSSSKRVSDELNHMLHKVIRVEDDIWGLARTLCKYGNVFGELLVTENGVVGVNYLPPPTVRRIEGPRSDLLGFIQDIRGEFNVTLEDFYKLAAQQQAMRDGKVPPDVRNISSRNPGELTVFEDWELVHWRLRGKHLRSIYGSAVIDPARWVWKRLVLLEDAMLIYKLERAPARYAFYVDVGEMDAERGLAYVNRVKNSFSRKKFVNQQGKLDMRFNPLGQDEDFFVPVRGGKRTTEIDVLAGPDYSEVETVEYHRDKLVSSIKIPKVYMGYGGESTRNALSSEDIRFARTIMRVQRTIRGGWRQVFRVHLVARGMDKEKLDYDARMNVPSQIMELARLEVMSATADLAGRMREDVGTKWVLMHLYKFSEEEALMVMDERAAEKMAQARVDAEVQKIMMPPAPEVLPPGEAPPPEGPEMLPSHMERARSDRELEERMMSVLRSAIRARPMYDWRRAFEGAPGANKAATAKIEQMLKDNRALHKRLGGLTGLMSDIRQAMRSLPPMV